MPKRNAERDELLQQFGKYVLQVLEADDDWSADTTDIISSKAMDLGLAELGEESQFKIKEDE